LDAVVDVRWELVGHGRSSNDSLAAYTWEDKVDESKGVRAFRAQVVQGAPFDTSGRPFAMGFNGFAPKLCGSGL
jgi:hypothetical protein